MYAEITVANSSRERGKVMPLAVLKFNKGIGRIC